MDDNDNEIDQTISELESAMLAVKQAEDKLLAAARAYVEPVTVDERGMWSVTVLDGSKVTVFRAMAVRYLAEGEF